MNRPFVISIIGFVAAAAALSLALSLDNADEMSSAPIVPAMTVSGDSRGSEPEFDVVRVGEKGDAMLAGRALPGAELRIFDGGRELGRTVADIRGEWVFVPTGPLPAGVRPLTLTAHNPGGVLVEGAAPVLLVVLGQGDERPLALKPLAGGGIKLLNGLPGQAGRLSIDLLDRGDDDRLFVAGRAPSGAHVNLYAGKRLLGRVQAEGDGTWRLHNAEAVDEPAGLRAEQVDGKGKVEARIEVSARADLPPTGLASGGFSVAAGPAQWRIARQLPSGKTAVTVVFAAGQTP